MAACLRDTINDTAFQPVTLFTWKGDCWALFCLSGCYCLPFDLSHETCYVGVIFDSWILTCILGGEKVKGDIIKNNNKPGNYNKKDTV